MHFININDIFYLNRDIHCTYMMYCNYYRSIDELSFFEPKYPIRDKRR